MWLYAQISGTLYHRSAPTDKWTIAGMGYAGNGDGINNPLWQGVKNHGPIPVGKYTIRPYVDKSKGPVVFILWPDAANQMHGRAGFMIHWDNKLRNWTASEGCICFGDALPFAALTTHVNAGDNALEVIEQPPLVAPF